MILTVTLNPAVDKTCNMKELRCGEVNRLTASISMAGGKGINVAKVLRCFRLSVMAMGFLGGNTGKFIEETMEKMGADCFFTLVEGDTRVNTNLIEDNGRITEILEPGPEISEKALQSFLKCYEGCLEQCQLVVLAGSLPQGVPVDFYRVLIERAKLYGVKTVLDTSGVALLAGIAAGPYMVKPNRPELEQLVGRKLNTREELAREATFLLDKGIQKVVVSLGSEGMMYVDREGSLFQPAKKVEVVSTVGCGDTAVASFCMSELAGDDRETALIKAVALSAANATTPGCGEIPMDTYLSLL